MADQCNKSIYQRERLQVIVLGKIVTNSHENSKRIAKNTGILYLRMFFMMAISLFTSRVILQTLGVNDFGIYNVVGGVVSMFSILSNSLSSSISRFLTFELGKKNYDRLKTIFCTAINVQILMAIVILVIAEVAGVWFLNYKMNIPPERLDAANWTLQCSLFTFVISVISVPYNASIVSHERMSAFAWISIIEASLKLGIVYLLWLSPYDKLKAYATLMFCVSLLVFLTYRTYCKRHFEECHYHILLDKPLMKEMTSFAGWGFLGSSCMVMNTQAIDILINIFFGVALNAARGISKQVESAVTLFVTNFMTALNPQITKSYATSDWDYMHNLVCWGAKFSYFLMLFFAIPICFETSTILHLWLGIVPDYTISFVRLTLAASMTTILGNTMVTAIQATGHIKKYQIVVSIWGATCFPLTWIAFKMGFSPVSAYFIYFIVYFALIFIRIYLVKNFIHMTVSRYFCDVLIPVLFVSCLAIILPTLLCSTVEQGMFRFIFMCILSMISTIGSIYLVGLKKNEKQMILMFIKNKISIRK